MWWLFGTGTWLPMSESEVFATRTGFPFYFLYGDVIYLKLQSGVLRKKIRLLIDLSGPRPLANLSF